MKKTSKTVLFFGNERLATGVTTTAPALRALISGGYNVAAVVVAQNNQAPSRRQRLLEVEEVAKEHNIPVIAPAKLSEAEDEIKAFRAEAGVLVAYGKKVPESIIKALPKGIVNIHPSLLPLHRGPTPIESAILNGERETGVSLMCLGTKLDAGPVYAQVKLPLPRASKQTLSSVLLEEGVKLLMEHLPGILDGSAPEPAPQNEALAIYDDRIQKEDGAIDYLKSAEQLEREIRAYAGWPRSRTTLGGKEVVITQAKVIPAVGAPGSLKTDGGKLIVFCKWGALEIEKLIPAGKAEMTAKAFLAGYGRLLT